MEAAKTACLENANNTDNTLKYELKRLMRKRLCRTGARAGAGAVRAREVTREARKRERSFSRFTPFAFSPSRAC